MTQLTQLQEGRRLTRLRTASVAWRAFGLGTALAEILIIGAISVACGIGYHLIVHDSYGELVNFIALGGVVALIFLSANAFIGDYALPLYIAPTSRIRRPLASWNIAFLYTLAISVMAKSGAELSRGNVILLYFAGIGAIMLWRWLVIRLVVRASKTGQVAARRVLLVGERAAIEAFARRYQPWNLGFEIVGQAVLQPSGSLEPDLDRAALIGRALHPDDVFVILPWSDTETIERVVDRLMTLPVSIHLGPERILDRFAKVQIIKVSDMATLCLARPPLTFLEVVAKRLFDIVGAALGLVLLLPFFLLIAALIRLDSPGPAVFRQQRYGFNQKPFWIYQIPHHAGPRRPPGPPGDPRRRARDADRRPAAALEHRRAAAAPERAPRRHVARRPAAARACRTTRPSSGASGSMPAATTSSRASPAGRRSTACAARPTPRTRCGAASSTTSTISTIGRLPSTCRSWAAPSSPAGPIGMPIDPARAPERPALRRYLHLTGIGYNA